MKSTRTRTPKAVDFEATGRPMIQPIQRFIKSHNDWVSFTRIMSKFYATPINYVRDELNKAVEQGVLIKEVRMSGTYYMLSPKPEKKTREWKGSLEAARKLEAKLLLARRKEAANVLEVITKRYQDNSLDDCSNTSLRYALEAAYEEGFQAGREKG